MMVDPFLGLTDTALSRAEKLPLHFQGGYLKKYELKTRNANTTLILPCIMHAESRNHLHDWRKHTAYSVNTLRNKIFHFLNQ